MTITKFDYLNLTESIYLKLIIFILKNISNLIILNHKFDSILIFPIQLKIIYIFFIFIVKILKF